MSLNARHVTAGDGGALVAPVLGRSPEIHPEAFVAPTAVLLGPVRLGARAGVWFHTVLRADGDEIIVGEESNIQDGVVVHTDPGQPVRIGPRVSVGHNAVLHGCEVDHDVLIGMGATLLNGARVGAHCVVAAGTVVGQDRHIPPRSLVAGPHATVVRSVNDEDLVAIAAATQTYLALNRLHRPAGRLAGASSDVATAVTADVTTGITTGE
ncbi:gamma carbonic anhydrase family protein [Streptomyces sp. URMC 123]|uniref:gamma carbonic anhydrase family protein n=1 Tax=Streptomyces sp. URMC 123 TaxID=3423403 RepID=UPI003F1BDC07